MVLYNSSDVMLGPFLKPSAVDPPITLLEAMSCGKIMIASNVQSMPYIIKDGENGFLLHDVTVDNLYTFLRKVINHHDRLKSLEENARKTIVQNFGTQDVLDRLLELYKRIHVALD